MRQDNPIHQVLTEVLTNMGFSRKGDSWFHRNRDIVQVVNLQKSQYGKQYYLNYGLWFLTLGETTHPREEKCHIRLRIEDFSKQEEHYKELLNLESDQGDESRIALLREAFSTDLVPFIRRTNSIENLQRLYATGALKGALIYVVAKRFLDGSATGIV